MTGGSDGDDIDAIKQRKAEELQRRAGSPDEPIHVTGGDHLEDLSAEHSPLLVDFHAEWCGPCQMLEPIVDSLAAETPGTVAKVDVDDHQQLAGRYQVQGVPTLLLFVDGELTERMVGAQDESRLRSLIDAHA